MARPTHYTPEIVKTICDKLCEGIPLEEICRMDNMPSAQTIHSWKRKDKPESVPDSVSEDIAHARDIGYDAIANRLRATARGQGDSTQDVQRDKLIIDTDLKLLSKWTKKYGDSTTLKGDADNPLSMILADRLDKITRKNEDA